MNKLKFSLDSIIEDIDTITKIEVPIKLTDRSQEAIKETRVIQLNKKLHESKFARHSKLCRITESRGYYNHINNIIVLGKNSSKGVLYHETGHRLTFDLLNGKGNTPELELFVHAYINEVNILSNLLRGNRYCMQFKEYLAEVFRLMCESDKLVRANLPITYNMFIKTKIVDSTYVPLPNTYVFTLEEKWKTFSATLDFEDDAFLEYIFKSYSKLFIAEIICRPLSKEKHIEELRRLKHLSYYGKYSREEVLELMSERLDITTDKINALPDRTLETFYRNKLSVSSENVLLEAIFNHYYPMTERKFWLKLSSLINASDLEVMRRYIKVKADTGNLLYGAYKLFIAGGDYPVMSESDFNTNEKFKEAIVDRIYNIDAVK